MNHTLLTRRALLAGSSLVLGGCLAPRRPVAGAQRPPAVTLGLLTDMHYADKPARGSRFYRDTLAKADEAVARFNDQNLHALVHLGDLVDSAPDVEQEAAYARTIGQRLHRFRGSRHFVLGNHCVESLTKAEFADCLKLSGPPHYAFDLAGVRFVVLDACFSHAGQPFGRKQVEWHEALVPAAQLRWLTAELNAAPGPVIVFIHQRIDTPKNDKHAVKNASAVRSLLQKSANVLAVFQGHSHHNEYQQIAGIHYVTLAAMIEGPAPASSAFAQLSVFDDGSLRLDGFRRQSTYGLRRA